MHDVRLIKQTVSDRAPVKAAGDVRDLATIVPVSLLLNCVIEACSALGYRVSLCPADVYRTRRALQVSAAEGRFKGHCID